VDSQIFCTRNLGNLREQKRREKGTKEKGEELRMEGNIQSLYTAIEGIFSSSIVGVRGKSCSVIGSKSTSQKAVLRITVES